MDEKRDELRFFINPLLDKSIKYKDLEDSGFEPMMTLRVDRPAGQKNDTTGLATENKDEKGCHSEDESSCSGQMADHGAAMQTFFYPTCLSRFYAVLCNSSL